MLTLKTYLKITCLIFLIVTFSSCFLISTGQKTIPLPSKIFSGEVHFARIPYQYWEHRIQTIKAMGLNTLSVYIMWNYHQIQRGKFDFKTENKNIDLFLSLAEKHQMKVLIRPGPYVCAEWDFGGLPVRLYNVPDMKIRSNNAPFLEETKIYFAAVAPIIKSHLKTQNNPNGSIIMMQIQNQYGSYGQDLDYIDAIRKIWSDLEVNCPLYHEDGAGLITRSHWPGANIGLSGGITKDQYDYARSVERKGIIFGGQIYTGWLTHWGQPWAKNSITKNIGQFSFLISQNTSFSMYMIHGGTNFGLTAGANSLNGASDYQADITSYDYDSPITEQGEMTQKYTALRALLLPYVQWSVPQPPKPIPVITVNRFLLKPIANLLANLPSPAISNSSYLLAFQSKELQMYNQGFVVYETTIKKRAHYFKVTPRDHAQVVLDGKLVATLNRMDKKIHDFMVNCTLSLCNLKIIVQAMGHVNYGHLMDTDIKGLFNISDDLQTNFTWSHYKIPIDDKILTWSKLHETYFKLPALLHGTFNSYAGDTFFDMSQFTKGYVWINGRNLGRYWNIGPQERLYCPGVWMKDGVNTVHVLELHHQNNKTIGITGKTTLYSANQMNFRQVSEHFRH